MRIALPLILSSVLLLSGCSAFLYSLGNNPEMSLSNIKLMENTTKLTVPTIPPGTRDGEYLRYYPDGKLKYKSWVTKGCFDRYVNAYNDNGKLKMVIPLKNCEVNGVVKSYQANGNIYSEIAMRDGLPYGAFKYYHNTPKNNVNLQGYMENSTLVGVITQYDENGKVINKGQILDGKIKILK
ncbi:MORN repeat variant [Proteus vulgaris]|uniref:toxin-antitoxin system YwqK family antitoxin n=1 Tax=Proteus vulgaris TaxID=585 RepID=UPI000E043964|nr:hypothetical protein [Proteus vulgaris]SUC00615.1 MORN repeat variant [Proteus vulgaris]